MQNAQWYILGCLIFLVTGCKDASKKVDTFQTEKTLSAIPKYNFKEFQAYYLNNTSDTTYVLNFWATWCKPCVKELPYFEQVGAMYKEKGVKVILVSLDFPEQLDHLRNFIEKKEIASEVVFLDDGDANRWIPLVDDSWSGAIPATIIYNNKKRNFFEGSYTYDQLETEIKTFL